jgi:hypothetical protein
MSKRVLDYDPFTGITTYFDYIPKEDRTIIFREQDVQPILEANKVLQNDTDITKQGIKDSWWRYAQIPNVIAEKWINEHGVNIFDKNTWGRNGAVWRLLNDPQYRYLKTTAKFHAG